MDTWSGELGETLLLRKHERHSRPGPVATVRNRVAGLFVDGLSDMLNLARLAQKHGGKVYWFAC